MKFGLTLLLIVCTLFPVQAYNYNTMPQTQFQVNTVRSNSYYYSNQNNTITRPGSANPRKVKGYTATGDSINTDGRVGNPADMWEDGYSYYYYNGHWYRRSGNTWEQWNTLFGWGLFGWDWQGANNPGNGATQYYEQNPTPIGNGLFIMLALSTLYIVKKRKVLKLQ